MKYTVVPAQVTTVEDRIAGSLGMNQLLLLIAPMFFGSALYIVLPPNLHFAPYKIALAAVLLVVCALSAIRIKGKLLILWVITIARYNLRPRYYLYDKNSLAGREQYEAHKIVEIENEEAEEQVERSRLPQLALPDKVRLEALLGNPAANFTFKSRKGGLDVIFTEVKD